MPRATLHLPLFSGHTPSTLPPSAIPSVRVTPSSVYTVLNITVLYIFKGTHAGVSLENVDRGKTVALVFSLSLSLSLARSLALFPCAILRVSVSMIRVYL